MTLEIGLLFAVLAVMVYLFLTEKLPVDLTAFLGLVFLIFAGYVEPGEAFQGFASSAVITMLSVFIVSAALLNTGLADMIAGRLHAVIGGREIPLVVSLMLIAGVLSAFMNNIAATAVLMPAVAALAARARISPSRLFMPLAFGAILGGTTTLIGTPPNILAGEMLRERGLEPFALFDFTPLGLVLLGVGALFMVTAGRRLLPVREPAEHSPGAGGGDLAQLYQVQDKLFTLRLAADSALDGQSLSETRLGRALGVKLLAIRRGRQRLRPRGDTALHGGDVLLLQGRVEALRELRRLRDVEVQRTTFDDLPLPRAGVGGVRARLRRNSPLVGQSLRAVAFRERYGLVVVAIRRGGRLIREELAGLPLEPRDRLLAIGPRASIEALEQGGDFAVEEAGFSVLAELRDQLFLLRVPASSPLAGSSLAASRLGELVGLTIAGIVRGGELLPAPSPAEVIHAGDRLVIAGEAERVETLLRLGEVELHEASEEALAAEDVVLVEAAVAPRSAAVGRTLRDLDFQNRYGMLALSIWRRGEPIHGDLADIPLALGDALLLEGSRRRLQQLVADPDLVVLTRAAEAPRRTRKAPVAVGGLLLMVLLVVTGWQPIHVASFTAASLVVLFGGAVRGGHHARGLPGDRMAGDLPGRRGAAGRPGDGTQRRGPAPRRRGRRVRRPARPLRDPRRPGRALERAVAGARRCPGGG